MVCKKNKIIFFFLLFFFSCQFKNGFLKERKNEERVSIISDLRSTNQDVFLTYYFVNKSDTSLVIPYSLSECVKSNYKYDTSLVVMSMYKVEKDTLIELDSFLDIDWALTFDMPYKKYIKSGDTVQFTLALSDFYNHVNKGKYILDVEFHPQNFYDFTRTRFIDTIVFEERLLWGAHKPSSWSDD